MTVRNVPVRHSQPVGLIARSHNGQAPGFSGFKRNCVSTSETPAGAVTIDSDVPSSNHACTITANPVVCTGNFSGVVTLAVRGHANPNAAVT